MAYKAPRGGPYRMYSPPAILKGFHFQLAASLWVASNYRLTFAGDTYILRKRTLTNVRVLLYISKGNTRAPQALCVRAKVLPSNTGQSSAAFLSLRHSTQD